MNNVRYIIEHLKSIEGTNDFWKKETKYGYNKTNFIASLSSIYSKDDPCDKDYNNWYKENKMYFKNNLT